MALTHELAGGAVPTDTGQQLDKLLASGFELLRDLTGSQPEAFAGLYLSWYGEAAGVIRLLMPGRLDEFNRLYRQDRRRRLDHESYCIEDYLLGVSLHGGFGQLDAMRAIAARRFHLQLLLLKSLQPALLNNLGDLRHQICRESAGQILGEAWEAAESGQFDLAIKLADIAVRFHLKSLFTRHNLKLPAKDRLHDLGKVLLKENILSRHGQAEMAQFGAHCRSQPGSIEDVSECLAQAEKIVALPG